MNAIENVDVLISGGGPVGLFFAYRMACLGHTFYLCDKKSGPTDETRALAMTPRTMETLESHSIAQHIMKEACVLHGAQIYMNGKKLGTMDACGDTNYPHITAIPQSRTEAILSRLLDADKIHRETELVQYEQNDNGVDAIVRDMNHGTEKRIQARYIIGADGSHSAVRKLASDWAYEGYSMATRFVVGDVFVSGKDADKIQNHRGNMFVGSDGWLGVIPAGEKDGQFYYRMFGNLEAYQLESDKSDLKDPTHGISRNDSVSLEEVQTIVNKRLSPLQVTVKDINGLSIFRINERKAHGFRRNRAFVMGDAAHCHSPVGGQGLNLGIQDADNLAWKLSLVLNGHSSDPEKLLDSYSIEREPIVAATLKTTGSATRYSLMKISVISTLIGLVMSTVLTFDRVKKNLMSAVFQLETQIPKESAILSQPANDATGLIEPGHFMRETTVLRKRDFTDDILLQRTTLHETLRGHGSRHTMMLICTRPSRYDPCPWTRDFYEKFTKHGYPPVAVRGMVIESSWHAHQSRKPEYAVSDDYTVSYWVEEHWDGEKSITKRIGLAEHMWDAPEPPAAIVVVRPDLYVAYSSYIRSAGDIDQAFNFLDGYIHNTTN
ncbi:FAD binding domain-containing protein [Fennellomyces sp. T-0311]|nr:FAD binding domain-containing protein [Fennellomyces sp. T-0311]